jgi:prepilin-type N-terminal cleavage/methylation domain-containing protein
MRRGFTLIELFIVIAIFGIIASLIGSILIKPYFEMRTFNKFNESGEKATYFDALFSELRVEAQK